MICLIGPPACGKGTQANILKKDGYEVFSFGEFFRQEILKKTDFGNSISNRINNGEIIELEEVWNNLEHSIFEQKNLILDGFPRTIEQANFFYLFCKKNNLIIDYVIEFVVDEIHLISRVQNRVLCQKCSLTYSKVNEFCQCGSNDFEIRKDDEINIFQKRLQVYKNSIDEISSFFKEKNFYKTIDANGSIIEITKIIENIFSS